MWNHHYELTNHLGNVLAVVTDRKMGIDTTADTNFNPQYYLPDLYPARAGAKPRVSSQ
jgi:hypothetical protein